MKGSVLRNMIPLQQFSKSSLFLALLCSVYCTSHCTQYTHMATINYPSSRLARSALDLIGDTPLLQLPRLPEMLGIPSGSLFAKVESVNPGGRLVMCVC